MEETDHDMEEEDDDDSILTTGRTDAWYEYNSDNDDDENYPTAWIALQRQLDARSAVLTAALTRQPSLATQIRQRERLARCVREIKLLQEAIEEEDEDDENNTERLYALLAAVQERQAQLQSRAPTLFQRVAETVLYETNTFGKAALCLLLHSVAMESFFDTVKAMFDVLYSQLVVLLGTESSRFQYFLYGIVLVLGLVLIRSTGYLSWWLKDHDYDLLKMDYHNRLRLGFGEARFISSVRRKALLCLVTYMIGYNLVFNVAVYLHGQLDGMLDQPSLFDNLPSNLYPFSDDGFICDRTCSEGMKMQQAHEARLIQADHHYTKQTLSTSSHDMYWWNYVHSTDYLGPDENTAHTETTELLHSVYVFAVCLLLLSFYGFYFWRTF